jgi:PhnB protein
MSCLARNVFPINWSVLEVAEAKRVFEALAEGGDIQIGLGETFFSPAFGMCTDRFGTPWMIMADMPTT